MPRLVRSLLTATALLGIGLLGACHTVDGVGKDVSAGARGVEKSL
jgi:predicted small secreted protein